MRRALLRENMLMKGLDSVSWSGQLLYDQIGASVLDISVMGFVRRFAANQQSTKHCSIYGPKMVRRIAFLTSNVPTRGVEDSRGRETDQTSMARLVILR
jgi:hypothetical protein